MLRVAGCYTTAGRIGSSALTHYARNTLMRAFAFAVLVVVASVTTSGGLRTAIAFAQDENMKMAMKLLEEAGAAFQNGKAKEAIELATKAAKLDPKNPAAPFVIGSAH